VAIVPVDGWMAREWGPLGPGTLARDGQDLERGGLLARLGAGERGIRGPQEEW